MKSIIGRKMGMTEVFAADGTMYPVTVIEVLPNVIVGKKTIEKDGYEASFQTSSSERKPLRKTATKPSKSVTKTSPSTASTNLSLVFTRKPASLPKLTSSN